MTWLFVALGGAVGTLGRYGLARLASQHPAFGIPWGTLSANLIGSFLLGIVVTRAEGRTLFGVDAQLVLGVGVMGGFTTYSSFNLETLKLFEESGLLRASLYLGLTIISCLVGGFCGLALGRSVE
jgi:CrcB protein